MFISDRKSVSEAHQPTSTCLLVYLLLPLMPKRGRSTLQMVSVLLMLTVAMCRLVLKEKGPKGETFLSLGPEFLCMSTQSINKVSCTRSSRSNAGFGFPKVKLGKKWSCSASVSLGEKVFRCYHTCRCHSKLLCG